MTPSVYETGQDCVPSTRVSLGSLACMPLQQCTILWLLVLQHVSVCMCATGMVCRALGKASAPVSHVHLFCVYTRVLACPGLGLQLRSCLCLKYGMQQYIAGQASVA